jgi:DUF4097 and DUF4098 domain-containing protein YvlB
LRAGGAARKTDAMSFRRRVLRCLSLLLVAAPLAWGAIERVDNRVFPVQPGCTLKLDTYRGAILVTEGDQPEISVALTLRFAVDTEEEADRIREALNLEMKAEGNTVVIRARNPRETRIRFVWHDKYQIDLSYVITVPRQCHVDLTTLNGGIKVGNLEGNLVARADTGSISFKRITGSVEAKTNFGEILVSRCSGAVKLHVLRGTLRVGTVGGTADLKNDSGDIEVLGIRANAKVYCAAGDVTIGFYKGVAGDSRVDASGGNIYAKIDPEAACAIEASSVFGRVESKLPVEIETGALGKSRLSAKLNAGGPRLTLHANGGHVKLSPLDTALD